MSPPADAAAPAPRTPDAERLAFRQSPDATLILQNRIILSANLMAERLFGYAAGRLQGQSVERLYLGSHDFRIIGERAYEALRASDTYMDERFMRHAQGHALWVQGRGRALSPGDPSGLSVWTYRLIEEASVRPHNLTPAEMRVARYLIGGFTSKEIAASLSCSARTVEAHRAAMIRKLGVRNSTELIGRLLAGELARAPGSPPPPS